MPPRPGSLQPKSSNFLQNELHIHWCFHLENEIYWVITQWGYHHILGMGPNIETEIETAGLSSHTVDQSFLDYRVGN